MAAATEPAPSFYEQVGGRETFQRIVDAFYREVALDDVLKPMYPEEDLGPAAERLLLFLEQYWGGPKTYSETRGHPRLRMRHMPFKVNPDAPRSMAFLHAHRGRRGGAVPYAPRDALGLPRSRRARDGQHVRGLSRSPS